MAGDQPSIAVADAGVIPVPPIGATARTGVPIGDAAIAAIIAIVLIAVIVIWEAAGDEKWKTYEIAVEVMEARASMHRKPAAAESSHPAPAESAHMVRKKRHSSTTKPAMKTAATKAAARFRSGYTQ